MNRTKLKAALGAVVGTVALSAAVALFAGYCKLWAERPAWAAAITVTAAIVATLRLLYVKCLEELKRREVDARFARERERASSNERA